MMISHKVQWKGLFTSVTVLWMAILFGAGTISNNGLANEEFVEMKIVEEPSSFGLNYAYGSLHNANQETLKLRVQPANFSGPPHFNRLIGRCFSSEIQSYRYDLCPFSNVTQHEVGVHWNPYHGVLGVWQDWEVRDNRFVAMVMREGDSCGKVFRSMRVSFLCGNSSQIVNVSEAETCDYHMTFMTPLVCHQDAMLVYPTLTPDLQHAWDKLEGQMQRGELTQKGYDRRLEKIFEEASIIMSQKQRTEVVTKAEKTAEEEVEKDVEFSDLVTCCSAYKKLKEEIKSLKDQLKQATAATGNASAAETDQVNLPGPANSSVTL